MKNLRKEAGLTQKEMADKIGLNYYTYRNKEKGEKPFKIDEVWQIAQTLKLSTDIIIKSILGVK